MSDNYLGSCIFFGLVSLAIYFLFLKQQANARAPVDAAGAPTRQTSQTSASTRSTRSPPHLSKRTRPNAHGRNVLIDGIVGFRNTLAAYRSVSATDADVERKDRARILSRLLELSSLQAPPPKGSTVIISVSEQEVSCSQLQRVLHVLGSYYNLLVVLVGDEKSLQESGRVSRIKELRTGLSADVVPDHRILCASTVAGRVALVRQVEKVGVVVDFDDSVRTQLERFGHSVCTYGAAVSVGRGESRLGKDLLP